MQQIYMQSNEHFEVFTTVFSPQVCRSRTRHRHTEVEKMVVAVNYRPHWPDELELRHGDVIHVLFKEDESWWFGRRENGQEGYFPATYVTKLIQNDEPPKVSPSSLKRGSVEVTPAEVLRGCTGAQSLKSPRLKKEGALRGLGQDTSVNLADPPAHASPSLFHRILSRSRRRSSCPSADLSGTINGAFEPD